MAKPRHNQTPPQQTPSRAPLAFLTLGALLVAGLVVWALTRTVESPATPPPSALETASPAPVIDTAATTTPAVDSTASSGFNTPLAATTAGITTSSNVEPQTPDESNFPRISAEDLREKMKAGTVTVIDVRPPSAYQAEHITGSLNMALASVESSLAMLPDKSKEIVAYCTCPAEESSIGAGLILKRHGYNKVSALFGGLSAWRNLGYPIERGAAR